MPVKEKVIDAIIDEYNYACTRYSPFNSAHEGYAIILEEMDELWKEVKRNSKNRTEENLVGMRKEAIQVAAMAMRIVIDCCL
jgi:hypothetical protein